MDAVVRARELGQRYLEGRASALECAELEQLLRENPAAADAFARLGRLEIDLGALFSQEPGRRRYMEVLDAIERVQRRRQFYARSLRLAVAACLLLLVGGPLLWWLAQPDVVPPRTGHVVLEGTVRVAGVSVQQLEDGDRLQVGGAMPARIRLADGSRALLQPDTLAVLHGSALGVGQQVELLAGEGRFTVPAGNAFQVETAAGAVSVHGTEFSVKLTEPDKGDHEMGKRNLVLAVMVFAGLVQVETSEGRQLLGVGESRVFGQQRDRNPPRSARNTQVLGTVAALDGNKLTILTGRRSEPTELKFDVGASVKILIDGKPGKLSQLARGMMVRLEKNDKDELLGISAEGPTSSGRIKEIKDGKITLVGRRPLRGRDSEDLVYPVAVDVKVAIDRQPAKLADLKPGTVITLKLSADRKQVVAIHHQTVRRLSEGAGEIKSMDEKGGTITVGVGRGEDRTLTLAKTVKVTIDGKPGKLADLQRGTRVMLKLDESKTVQEIIASKRLERPSRSIRGIITDLKGSKLTLVGGARRGETEESFDVPAPAKILVDGKGAKLADLAKGMLVEIAKDQKGEIASILAEGPTITGTVKSLEDGKLTLAGRGRDTERTTYQVAADVRISIDGKPGKLADVKADMPVILKLSADRKTVVGIMRIQRPERGERNE